MNPVENPRDRIHFRFCPDDMCRVQHNAPGDRCKDLDELLDQVADPNTSLVAAYRQLLDMHMDTLLTHGPQVAQGLALAITKLAPLLPAEGAPWVVASPYPDPIQETL